MLLTTSVLKQREVPATVSSFYVSVLYTAMLRTSIVAVVLGCFYFCPLDCDASVMVVDCAAVETGCMLEKYKMVAHPQCYNKRGYIRTWHVYKIFFFIFRLMRYTDVCFFHSRAFCFRVNRLHNQMKPSNTTTSGKATDMMAGICTFPRLLCPCTKRHVMLNVTSTGVCNTGTSALYVCNLLL